MRQKQSMLASVFTDGAAQVPLTDYFDALLPQIPALRGVELVEVRQGQPRTVARAGANQLLTVRRGLIIAWITARFFK